MEPAISARYVRLNVLSGRQVDIGRPSFESIVIEDIAYGLAGKFRWAGQSRYTVAQHSVEVSRRVPTHLALSALLHDAPEAYLGDVPGPLKAHLLVDVSCDDRGRNYIGYGQFETLLMNAIAVRFHLPGGISISPAIHEADRRERARERREFFGHVFPAENLKWPAYPEPIAVLCPAAAEADFLERFHALYRDSSTPNPQIPKSPNPQSL